MDTNNLDTHTYLLISTAYSWLQNKQMELMKHIHASFFHFFLFSDASSYLGYFHLPAELNSIIESTKNRKE